MARIKKFNDKENFDTSKEDFEIGKKEVLMTIERLIEEYGDFVNDVSPKHWRTTGHHFTELRKMIEEINSFTPITITEKEIDWVREERFKKN